MRLLGWWLAEPSYEKRERRPRAVHFYRDGQSLCGKKKADPVKPVDPSTSPGWRVAPPCPRCWQRSVDHLTARGSVPHTWSIWSMPGLKGKARAAPVSVPAANGANDRAHLIRELVRSGKGATLQGSTLADPAKGLRIPRDLASTLKGGRLVAWVVVEKGYA